MTGVNVKYTRPKTRCCGCVHGCGRGEVGILHRDVAAGEVWVLSHLLGPGAAEAGCEGNTGIIDTETKLESNADWKVYLITY